MEKPTEGIDDKPVIDLFDEHWFFNNILISRKILERQPSVDSSSTEKGNEDTNFHCTDQEEEKTFRDNAIEPTSALFRMPTLPPRLQRQETLEEEAAVNSLKSCNHELRHSLSSLDNYQSSAFKGTMYNLSRGKDTPPRYIKLEKSERYIAIRHYIAKEAYYRKIFKEKKWKSSSDLEYIELQGFKDLGFVFDKKEANSSLPKIIPGLSDQKMMASGENIARPYLSEAWILQRSAPPMFRCIDKRSVEDMKTNLKFWARAVASNAREEC